MWRSVRFSDRVYGPLMRTSSIHSHRLLKCAERWAWGARNRFLTCNKEVWVMPNSLNSADLHKAGGPLKKTAITQIETFTWKRVPNDFLNESFCCHLHVTGRQELPMHFGCKNTPSLGFPHGLHVETLSPEHSSPTGERIDVQLCLPVWLGLQSLGYRGRSNCS